MAGNGVPDAEGADTVAEIVVPDSYTGFVRLLLFLYTGDPTAIASCIPNVFSQIHLFCVGSLEQDAALSLSVYTPGIS